MAAPIEKHDLYQNFKELNLENINDESTQTVNSTADLHPMDVISESTESQNAVYDILQDVVTAVIQQVKSPMEMDVISESTESQNVVYDILQDVVTAVFQQVKSPMDVISELTESQDVVHEILQDVVTTVFQQVENKNVTNNTNNNNSQPTTNQHKLLTPLQICYPMDVTSESTESQEIVDEILQDVVTAVFQQVETKNVTNNTNNNNSVVILQKNALSLVPYDVSSESGTEDSESDSESSAMSSTASSSSSDSDDSDDTVELEENRNTKKTYNPTKTQGELGLEDLPQIEHLQISAEGCKLVVIGHVHAIVDVLVVIKAELGSPTLDLDSFIFADDGFTLGQVFDVFGNTQSPFYSIRFNNVHEITDREIVIGNKVYYAPERTNLYSTVFVDDIRRQKGSDASWEFNNEPPDHCLDYSDDEQERLAKQKLRAKRVGNDGNEKAAMSKRSRGSRSAFPRPHLRNPFLSPCFSTSSLPVRNFTPSFPQYQFSFPSNFQAIRQVGPLIRFPPPDFSFCSFQNPPPPPPPPPSPSNP